MMRKLLLGLLVIVVLAMVGFAIVWFSTEPEKLLTGTESASRLISGPYSVGRSEMGWIDTDRGHTSQNGEIGSSGQRVLPTTIWYPGELARIAHHASSRVVGEAVCGWIFVLWGGLGWVCCRPGTLPPFPHGSYRAGSLRGCVAFARGRWRWCGSAA